MFKYHYFLSIVFLSFSAQAVDSLELRRLQHKFEMLQDQLDQFQDQLDELKDQSEQLLKQPMTKSGSSVELLLDKYAGKVFTMRRKLADSFSSSGIDIPNVSCSNGVCKVNATDFILALDQYKMTKLDGIFESNPESITVTINGKEIYIYRYPENREIFDFLVQESRNLIK